MGKNSAALIKATIIPGGAVTFLNGLRALAQVEGEARSGRKEA